MGVSGFSRLVEGNVVSADFRRAVEKYVRNRVYFYIKIFPCKFAGEYQIQFFFFSETSLVLQQLPFFSEHLAACDAHPAFSLPHLAESSQSSILITL